ncbi:uncharacterized protein METZ01_LOCUS292776, partial [marine metagenome]
RSCTIWARILPKNTIWLRIIPTSSSAWPSWAKNSRPTSSRYPTNSSPGLAN